MSFEYKPKCPKGQLSFVWSATNENVRRQRRLRSKLMLLTKPPEDIASKIFEAAQRHAIGRTHRLPHPVEMLHISLVCIGEFDVAPLGLIKRLRSAMERLQACPANITMDESSIFGGGKSLVLKSAADTGELACLAERLKGLLRQGNLPYIETGRIEPHVTVIYGCGRIELVRVIKPYSWTVRNIELVFSHHGETRHECFGLWTLLKHATPYQRQYALSLPNN